MQLVHSAKAVEAAPSGILELSERVQASAPLLREECQVAKGSRSAAFCTRTFLGSRLVEWF